MAIRSMSDANESDFMELMRQRVDKRAPMQTVSLICVALRPHSHYLISSVKRLSAANLSTRTDTGGRLHGALRVTKISVRFWCDPVGRLIGRVTAPARMHPINKMHRRPSAGCGRENSLSLGTGAHAYAMVDSAIDAQRQIETQAKCGRRAIMSTR